MTALRFPARLEYLEAVNGYLEQQIPSTYRACILQVRLAVEELLVNSMSYAYPDHQGWLEILCEEAGFDGRGALRVRLTDWGQPFDPFLDTPEPDISLGIEERPIGGLGVHLVKSVASSWTYTREHDANVIELFFSPPE